MYPVNQHLYGIPRAEWFTPAEQQAIVAEAAQIQSQQQGIFWEIACTLVFKKSIIDGKMPKL